MNIDPFEIINKSLCGTCAHRFSRLIEPATDEYRDYIFEKLGIDEYDDDLELFIEQHRCLIADEDLEGVVHDCNMYKPAPEYRLIREYTY